MGARDVSSVGGRGVGMVRRAGLVVAAFGALALAAGTAGLRAGFYAAPGLAPSQVPRVIGRRSVVAAPLPSEALPFGFAGLPSSRVAASTLDWPSACALTGVILLFASRLGGRKRRVALAAVAGTARRPQPAGIKRTANFREAAALSAKLAALSGAGGRKRVAVIGGGLSGLSAAKYLADAGHEPIVLEARDVLGGKVSAWQDKDGDWVETGLHIFFGAYPNMMNLFAELDIEDRLQWKEHKMTFAMQELPGEFTTFDFIPGVPAPFNMGLAVLLNRQMLTVPEKLQTAPPLVRMLLEGQDFIDAQDELSVDEFMRKYGMPDRIKDEVFISMGKALDFIDVDKLSMTVVLTAMNRFLNETDGSQTAFLDGNQPARLCAPMAEHIERLGGQVRTSAPLKEFVLHDDGSIKHLLLRSGETIEADEYISAVPVDIFKRLTPKAWSTLPYFRQLAELEGIPVMNLTLWFDRKLASVDGLCFSRSPLLSVYADMSTCCAEYADSERSVLSLVFAPCTPVAGGKENWLGKPDAEIVAATLAELARLFPTEIGPAAPGGGAQLIKHAVVKVPRSVYAAVPGRNKYRPSQTSPVRNLTLAGDWTSQKFLGSMEGAILAGKLAAEAVADKAAYGAPTQGIKPVDAAVVRAARAHGGTDPAGVKGDSPIAFGGGMVMGAGNRGDGPNPEAENKS